MKTIGVLGGIGPQATMDFEQRLHRVAKRLITAKHRHARYGRNGVRPYAFVLNDVSPKSGRYGAYGYYRYEDN